MSNKNAVVLTAEQKARIEANRKQALERLQARNLESSSTKSVTKILPSKAVPSSHRVNPYLKPPQNVRPTHPSSPQTSGITSSPNNGQRNVHCFIELISEERFLVKTNGYDERVIQEFKKVPSSIYNASTKHWSFRFSDYKQLIKGLDSLKKYNVSSSKIPEFVINTLLAESQIVDDSCLQQIEGKLYDTLIDFQKSGICFGLSKRGRCMIADDMGLGKSRQALGIADFYRDDWPLLIITNASTRQFWASEIENLFSRLTFSDVHIIQGSRDCFDNAQVVICSYNNLQGSVDDLVRKEFGVIIFDESHNLKNEKAKQTLNAEILSKNAQRVIMLTGTPALSRPAELFTQLKILDKSFATYYQFTARYCNGRQTKFGWNVSGSSNLEELSILLRKRFLIRRVKSDVFLELGAKNRELVILENYKYTSKFDDEMQEFSSQFHEANVNHKEAESILLKWYQTTSRVKAFGASVFVKKYLEENNCKILVFAHHNFMMNVLCTELEKVNVSFINIDGSIKGDVRAKRVEQFQTDPNIKAAILSIRACNAGITLTAASTVIFCEFDWNPSTIIQAEARAHRIGQENEVKVYFLMANETSDNVIWKLLQNKQKKLSEAGLVANVENLGENIKISNFDVQVGIFAEAEQPPDQKNEQLENKEDVFIKAKLPPPKIDYFEDDDIDDEELQKLVENLP